MFVCSCHAVRKSDIEKALREEGCNTIEHVQDATGAGTCCGACCEELESVVRALKPEADAGAARPPRKLA